METTDLLKLNRTRRRRIVAVLALAGFGLFCVALMLAVMPWTLRGTTRRAEIMARMSHATGFDIRAAGAVSVKLLPRPRVQVLDISVTAPDGSVDLSAPALTGELDIAALLRGHWRLRSVTLLNPTAAINADMLKGLPAGDHPFRLSVRSGVFRIVSRRLGTDTLVTDVTATADRAGGIDSGLSASGSVIWRTIPGQFTVEIGSPIRSAAEGRSGAFLQIRSPIASFSASGDLSGDDQPQFAGRVSASTNAPGPLLSLLGLAPVWMNVRKLSINGDALARIGDMSLSGAALRLNSTSFEGTLGYHVDNGHGLLEGTLATERLDLGDLAGHAIDRAGLAALYGATLAPHLADTSFDLRISAGELVVGNATAEEAALSLMSRDRRLEVTLDEAQAFGGVVKARLLATLLPADIDAHAEMTLTGVELGPLGAALMGQERMTGALSGKLALDGHGASLGDIVPTLSGEGQVSVENGNFMGVSVSQRLRRFTRRLPFGADQPGQVTSFASATSDLKIEKGIVTFIGGQVSGPGIAMRFGGHGDLPGGTMDVQALASPTDAAGSVVPGAPDLPIEMRGAWDEPLKLMDQSRRLTVPRVPLPGLDPGDGTP